MVELICSGEEEEDDEERKRNAKADAAESEMEVMMMREMKRVLLWEEDEDEGFCSVLKERRASDGEDCESCSS